MARITIASLQARIAELEHQLVACDLAIKLHGESYVALQAERDALLVAQRPSRRIETRPQAPRTAERPISDYKRACEAARAMAVATGRAVRVG